MPVSQTLSRVDVHAHYLPPFYRTALAEAGQSHPDGMPAIPEWSESRALAIMDRLHIAVAVLSISSPGVHFGDDRAAAKLSRRLNEEGTRLRKAHVDRFGLFAVTPLPNIELAIEEAVYAIDQLGAEGVAVESNHHGLYHGDPKLEPFYAELHRRKSAMFIHPTSPSCEGCLSLALGRPRPMLEFMFETTRTVTNLVLNGVTQRYPDLRIVVPHAGAALPVLASRVESQAPFMFPDGKSLPRMKDEMRKLYYDLAGAPLPELLQALEHIADKEHIFYGSDWPFTPDDATEKLALALDTTPAIGSLEREAYMHGNALRAFPALRPAFERTAQRMPAGQAG